MIYCWSEEVKAPSTSTWNYLTLRIVIEYKHRKLKIRIILSKLQGIIPSIAASQRLNIPTVSYYKYVGLYIDRHLLQLAKNISNFDRKVE